MATGLLEKYVYHGHEEYWKSGKIIEDIGNGFFLIEWDKIETSKNMTSLHSVVQMATQGEWLFFSSREELDEFLAWFNEPNDKEKKVVTLVRSK